MSTSTSGNSHQNTITPPRKPNEQDNKTQDENVKELLDKGKSYREIAGILGISKSLVGKIAARLKSVSTPESPCTNP